MIRHKAVVFIGLVTLIPTLLNSQVFTNKEVGKEQQAEIEEMKEANYPYSLPILGKKAAAAGYSLPYSTGVGTNFLWQKSDLLSTTCR